MRKSAIFLLATGLSLAAVFVAFSAVISTPMGTQPDFTPQLRIQDPDIPFDATQPIPVRVNYQNFDLQPALRCGPAGPCTGSTPQVVVNGRAQGHIHVYFQRVPDNGFPNVDSDSFCIPTNVVQDANYNGYVTGTCPAVGEKGVYRVSAEFQSNSHVSVLKATNKPQDVPTSDDKEVRAR